MALIVVICGAALLKGGLYLGKHEGDTLHLLQIVLRMADGQWPHLDFMTPIGLMAFAPIALFVKLGYGAGTSIMLAQTLVAIAFLPAVWWVAFSRMRGFLPYIFGLIIFVLIGALVHGEAQRAVSISMHYNRWAWAASFVAIAAAVIPNRGTPRPLADGLVIGLAMSLLLLIKITYFAAFALPVLIAMLLRGNFRAILVAAVSGLAVAGVITSLAGPQYWQAYLGDILAVARSDIRPNPSEPFGAVVGAPAYLGASLVLIGGVILLRQAREAVAGLVLLLLMPAFFYVTYQNFANDPQWLLLLGVLLIAFVPQSELKNGLGWDMRTALRVTAAIALAMAAPSFFNLAYSPFRQLNIDTSKYTPLLPRSERSVDLFASKLRAMRTDIALPMPIAGTGLEAYEDMVERPEPTVFQGETLAQCELSLGMSAWFDAVVRDLEDAGFAGDKRIFAADLLSGYWLFGDFKPLPGGAPWYYGGLPGIGAADYVLVPLCPIIPEVRRLILDEIQARGITLTEVRRT
ncbi:MAG: hypothetical protein ACC646_08305, partial [Paracoccaceae bacterium]